MHAHVDAAIEPSELAALNAVVFAVTRSLDEAHVAVNRRDSSTVWGVGCHPGLVASQKAFSAQRFANLLDRTAFAGEVGLDGKSRVPMATQVATFRSVMEVLRGKPRITTVHSYAACKEVLDLVADSAAIGVVLHWWLGSPSETARAVELGCYFSINAAMVRRGYDLKSLPIERMLAETDHPFGDRAGGFDRSPGSVESVETAIGSACGMSQADVRLQVWFNLRALVNETSVGYLLPSAVRIHLAAA